MARRSARPQPEQRLDLPTLTRTCPACGGSLWAAYMTQRTVTTLDGTVRLRLQVRRCRDPRCPRHRVPLRPEQEGRYALPEHELGVDLGDAAVLGVSQGADQGDDVEAELVLR